MRFRAGLILFIFSLLVGVGCRKPLTPNVDNNQAPETWITQAPQDTITDRDSGAPQQGQPSTVAVRFHMYWAGSDQDGTVAGYYYAVVETLPTPPPGLGLPPLPGPKPHDYRFTTKTDTTLIFDVSEFHSDRQHAFFIYAVDDKGKADPTPARFIFNALDRFPPEPVILEATAIGTTYRMNPDGTITSTTKEYPIHEVQTVGSTGNVGRAPADTVPSGSALRFRWRGEPRVAGTYITGYRYKLDEPDFVPTSDTSKVYAAGAAAPGPKLFSLKVLDQAGGADETNRRFQMNFAPTTWYAGPDPNAFPLVHGERVIDISSWKNCDGNAGLGHVAELQHSPLSIDSLTVLPALRPHRRTFYEIYGNKLFIRQPGDTVHFNSYLVFFPGGSDRDSPYRIPVKVNPALQDTNSACGSNLPMTVVHATGPNGSPIGARFTYWTHLNTHRLTSGVPHDVVGGTVVQPISTLLPVYDPALVTYNPAIAAYIPANVAGTVYFAFNAVDGDGASDTWFKKISQATKDTFFIDSVGAGDPRADNARMIAFHVDKSPALASYRPDFVPHRDTTFFTRDNIKFNLLADDSDPYNLDPSTLGGPAIAALRWTVYITGRTASNPDVDTTFIPLGANRVNTPQITISIPPNIIGTDLLAKVELCDCAFCEDQDGSGRCIFDTIPFHVPPPSTARSANPASLNGPRPGSRQTGRSQ